MKQMLTLLDKLRAIAAEGLYYAHDPHDKERYDKLMRLASGTYAELGDVHPKRVYDTLIGDLGCLTPKLGIVVVVASDTNDVLILRRSDDGTWCFPCGWVDIGEGVNAAGIREVREETGLSASIRGMIGTITKGPQEYATVSFHQINIVLLATPVSRNAAITLSDEHTDFRWIVPSAKVAWHAGHEIIGTVISERLDISCCPAELGGDGRQR